MPTTMSAMTPGAATGGTRRHGQAPMAASASASLSPSPTAAAKRNTGFTTPKDVNTEANKNDSLDTQMTGDANEYRSMVARIEAMEEKMSRLMEEG